MMDAYPFTPHTNLVGRYLTRDQNVYEIVGVGHTIASGDFWMFLLSVDKGVPHQIKFSPNGNWTIHFTVGAANAAVANYITQKIINKE